MTLQLPHAPPGYLSRHHAPVHAITRLLRVEEFMLMSLGDVITPSQHPHKHVQVSPSPRQCHIIRMSQCLYSSIRDQPKKPRIDPDHVSVDFDPRPVEFDL